MKWKSRQQEIYTKKTQWHKFFTIIPRKLPDENKQMWWVWFTTIERIGEKNFLGEWYYTYRLPAINNKTLN